MNIFFDFLLPVAHSFSEDKDEKTHKFYNYSHYVFYDDHYDYSNGEHYDYYARFDDHGDYGNYVPACHDFLTAIMSITRTKNLRKIS